MLIPFLKNNIRLYTRFNAFSYGIYCNDRGDNNTFYPVYITVLSFFILYFWIFNSRVFSVLSQQSDEIFWGIKDLIIPLLV